MSHVQARRLRQGAATSSDLQQVIGSLETAVAVVGLTERYDESIVLFAHAFAHTQPPNSVRSTHTHDSTVSSPTSRYDRSRGERASESERNGHHDERGRGRRRRLEPERSTNSTSMKKEKKATWHHKKVVWNELPEKSRQTVRKALSLDIELYKHALSVFERQLAAAPRHVRQAARQAAQAARKT